MDESNGGWSKPECRYAVQNLLCCGRSAIREIDDHEMSVLSASTTTSDKRLDWLLSSSAIKQPSRFGMTATHNACSPIMRRDGWSCSLDPSYYSTHDAMSYYSSPPGSEEEDDDGTALSFLESPISTSIEEVLDDDMVPLSPSPLPVLAAEMRGIQDSSPRRSRWWRLHPSLFISVSTTGMTTHSRCSATGGGRNSSESLLPFFDSADDTTPTPPSFSN